MSNILTKIVDDKRKEVDALKAATPLSTFVDNLTPSDRSFYDALAGNECGYIFECKKASPSKGLIREHFDLDEIIAAYAPHAACISVLTDEKYFQGKFDYLPYVRERVTQPVLNKDFFVDPYQVHRARFYQADAILLMLSVLDDEQYRELKHLAESYKLDVLTEVSNEEETHRAIALGANIIGINNRNLRDLSTDLAMTEKLVPVIRQAQHDCVIISESGIYTQQDVQRLAPAVDGFLVGSSLMAEADVCAAVRRLKYGTVKVCGITREDDARNVAQSGASYAGLIFVPHSKRYISTESARTIVDSVPFNYVGVFADHPIKNVADIASELSLSAVQLHGNEDQDYINALRGVLPESCQIWKAVGVSDALPDVSYHDVDLVLLDCKVNGQSGGTGQQFDWALLNNVNLQVPFAIAGGISPDNVAHAKRTGASLIDVNSGIEDAPGIKSQSKLKQIFINLNTYAPTQSVSHQ